MSAGGGGAGPAKPPRWVQRLAIPPLARLGCGRGLRASYPHHADVYAGWRRQAAAAALRRGRFHDRAALVAAREALDNRRAPLAATPAGTGPASRPSARSTPS